MIRLFDQARRTVREFDAAFGAGASAREAIGLVKLALLAFWAALALSLLFSAGASS